MRITDFDIDGLPKGYDGKALNDIYDMSTDKALAWRLMSERKCSIGCTDKDVRDIMKAGVDGETVEKILDADLPDGNVPKIVPRHTPKPLRKMKTIKE